MKPKYRAYAHGELRTVTQLEWNGEGVKYVYVYPAITRKYSTREVRKINRLPINEVELLAWTGRNDFNGTPVYQGDIVKDWEGIDSYEVVWNQTWACFEFKRLTFSNDTEQDAFEDIWKLEVIGTKYDQVEAT